MSEGVAPAAAAAAARVAGQKPAPESFMPENSRPFDIFGAAVVDDARVISRKGLSVKIHAWGLYVVGGPGRVRSGLYVVGSGRVKMYVEQVGFICCRVGSGQNVCQAT